MKQSVVYVMAVVLVGFMFYAHGYELATHAAITKQSFDKSVTLSSQTPDLFSVLGITISDPTNSFGSKYYDVDVANILERQVYSHENNIIKAKAINEQPLSTKGWLMRGAIREDDVVADSVNNGPCNIRDDKNPQDDLYPNPPDRPLNHFYDPINDRGLNQVVIGEKAIDWALGVENALADPPVEDAGRRNHFTLLDAREAQYRALTGRKSSDPADPTYPVVADADKIGPGGTSVTKADQDAYWATMFRSLGDLLHMIQDMAQPQHTRNDSHLDECEPFKFLVNKSIYEEYVNSRALGDTYLLKNKIPVQTEPLIFDTEPSYPIPSFNDAVSYSTTRNKDSQILDRRGMADYSNRGFFSAGTNLYQGPFPPKYDLPENNFPSYGKSTLSENWVHEPLKNHGQVVLLTNTVQDSLPNGQSVPDVPLTTYGIFDQFLDDDGYVKRYTLNRYNYDAMADLLIPRAVAYGAGLLDYFFRGRLEITLPGEGIYGVIDQSMQHYLNGIKPVDSGTGKTFGFKKVLLNVRNITPDIMEGQTTYPQLMGPGTLRAVARYRYNPCYTIDLSGMMGCAQSTIDTIPDQQITQSVSEAIAVTSIDATTPSEIEFDFTNEPIPVNATDLYIQVVFHGTLGAEVTNAIAVGNKDVSEPTYYLARNTTDYFSYYVERYRVDDQQYWPEFQADWRDEDGDQVPDPPSAPWAAFDIGPLTIKLGNIQDAVSSNLLKPGQYIRIAYIADPGPLLIDPSAPGFTGLSSMVDSSVWQEQPGGLPYRHDDTGSMGDGTTSIYFRHLTRLLRVAYPFGSSHGPDIFPHFELNPDPVNPDPQIATICFPQNVCSP